MRFSFKTPIILLLVVAGLYLAVKGAMYLRVKSAMDDIVDGAQGQAEISYEGISTELGGSASVQGIRIRPEGMEQALLVEQAIFSVDDPWVLISGDLGGEDSQPPEQLNLQFLGVTVPLDDRMLAAMQVQSARQGGAAANCDGGLEMEPQMFRDLGFESLRADVLLDYRFDRPSERMTANMAFEVHDIEHVEMSLELAGVLPEDMQSGRMTAPALVEAKITVDMKREFGDRFMKLCAERKQQTVDAYRATLLEGLHEEMAAAGVSLGAGLRQAMADFYRDWGEVRLRVRPEKPLDMLQLMNVSQGDLVNLLGLSLYVNDRLVPDLAFDFDIQSMVRKAQLQLQQEQEQGLSEPLDSPKAPALVRVTRHYQPVATDMLDQHLGGEVMIQPQGQPVRAGVLVGIADGEAQIEQRAYGGTLTTYVRLNEIESAQVKVVERKRIEE